MSVLFAELLDAEVASGLALYVDCNPADMLIPDALFPLAMRLRQNQPGWADVAAYLLTRHSQRLLAMAPDSQGYRMQYQSPQQALHRICYRPYREIHVKLRILSLMTRRSMTALISLMLEWESEEVPAQPVRGVPTQVGVTWVIQGITYKIYAHILPFSSLPPPE